VTTSLRRQKPRNLKADRLYETSRLTRGVYAIFALGERPMCLKKFPKISGVDFLWTAKPGLRYLTNDKSISFVQRTGNEDGICVPHVLQNCAEELTLSNFGDSRAPWVPCENQPTAPFLTVSKTTLISRWLGSTFLTAKRLLYI